MYPYRTPICLSVCLHTLSCTLCALCLSLCQMRVGVSLSMRMGRASQMRRRAYSTRGSPTRRHVTRWISTLLPQLRLKPPPCNSFSRRDALSRSHLHQTNNCSPTADRTATDATYHLTQVGQCVVPRAVDQWPSGRALRHTYTCSYARTTCPSSPTVRNIVQEAGSVCVTHSELNSARRVS